MDVATTGGVAVGVGVAIGSRGRHFPVADDADVIVAAGFRLLALARPNDVRDVGVEREDAVDVAARYDARGS